MNYLDLYSSYPDRTITSAWDAQLKAAENTPRFAKILGQCGDELFARFARCYSDLRTLPRGARRALQRRLARSSNLPAIFPRCLQQGGRQLQHRMAWSLAGAALLLALGQGVGAAATITVTTSNPNVAADGQCSLIEAIVNANNDAATYPDCAAGSGADTIVLPANANLTLTAIYKNEYTGLPLIFTQITIEGNGATISRQGNAPAFGLIRVGGSSARGHGALTLRGVTLSGGIAIQINGGAISNLLGSVTIENSIISGNSSGIGGGIYSYGALTIKNSTISGNSSSSLGGGIYSYGGCTIENSTISNNVSNDGGGIFIGSNPGPIVIQNSTISGNTAKNGGGGVYNSGGLTITNSTVSGNSGGLFNTGTLTLNNSLIAGNQATGAYEIENVGSVVNANNFNLFGTNGDTGICGFTPGPTDIVPAPGIAVANILGPLEDNGGPTPTHALLAGSPAINSGNPGGCRDDAGDLLLTDQRGFPRPSAGTICDIGSYELQAAASPGNSLKAVVNVALAADTVAVSETCPPLPPPPPPPPPLAMAATTLGIGEAGVSFTGDLMISGGVTPYIVSIIKGALPAGLSLGNDGIISGTISPRAKGASITVRITDSINESTTRTFTITVTKALSVSAKVKTGRMGRNYNASFRVKGGSGPFNWSITSGALPMGLSFNTATGAIAGMPTESGVFPLTVQVTDALGGSAAVNPAVTIH